MTVFAVFAFAMTALLVAEILLAGRASIGAIARGAVHLLAGIAAVAWPIDPAARFHWILLAWALLAGAIELATGIAARRRGSGPRDGIVVGALTLLLAVVSIAVSPQYSLDYFVDDAGQWFTLTGTIIGVGLFGGWAAVIAVYLGIGAFSPSMSPAPVEDPA